MKRSLHRKLFLPLSLLLLNFACLAQNEEEEEKESYSRVGAYGVVGGNLSKYRDDAGSEHLFGLIGGIGVAGFVGKQDMIAVEVSYGQQGSKVKGGTLPSDPAELRLNYLQIPAMYRLVPFRSSSFYITFGPQLNVFLGGHGELKSGEKVSLKEEMFAKTTFDANVGLGIRFGETIGGVEVRYQHGLSKVFNNSPDLRSSSFQFRYSLPLGFIAALFSAFGE